MEHQISVRVPRIKTRSVKAALETAGLLNKNGKITPALGEGFLSTVPTCITTRDTSGPGLDEAAGILFHILRAAVPDQTWSVESLSFNPVETLQTALRNRNPVQTALIHAWSLLVGAEDQSQRSHDDLLMRLGKSYCIYEPMLLLSASRDVHLAWDQLAGRTFDQHISPNALLEQTALKLNVTHIALNAPIPSHMADVATGEGDLVDNYIRSPVKLQTLYGDFGPLLDPYPKHVPTKDDFANAMWVQAKQNGIVQTWSPYYTMFSAGNVTEKTRLITLGTVQEAVAQGVRTGRGSAAVDLFAGIGYFAFSYLKAGVCKVLCWDLNPWSIEGLRRGAVANKWSVTVLEDLPVQESIHMETSILAFRESNEFAMARIEILRHDLPPIRHVNCGMLPSAGQSWKSAVDILDPDLGGWIHIHESLGVNELETRKNHIMDSINSYLETTRGLYDGVASLEHVERVKSVGPGLIHIVLDVWVPPNLILETWTELDVNKYDRV